MNDALFPKVLLSIFFVSTDKGAEPTTAHKKKDKKTKKNKKRILHFGCLGLFLSQGPNGVAALPRSSIWTRRRRREKMYYTIYIYICTHAYVCVCVCVYEYNNLKWRERERERRREASRDASHGADFFKPHDRSRADVLFALACASAIRASDRVGVLFVGVSTDGHLQLHRREVWFV